VLATDTQILVGSFNGSAQRITLMGNIISNCSHAVAVEPAPQVKIPWRGDPF